MPHSCYRVHLKLGGRPSPRVPGAPPRLGPGLSWAGAAVTTASPTLPKTGPEPEATLSQKPGDAVLVTSRQPAWSQQDRAVMVALCPPGCSRVMGRGLAVPCDSSAVSCLWSRAVSWQLGPWRPHRELKPRVWLTLDLDLRAPCWVGSRTCCNEHRVRVALTGVSLQGSSPNPTTQANGWTVAGRAGRWLH